ncbi:hypothetical protein [Aeromicrobium sp. Leaf291]|nr:hypothetical protein [Aeromicrobium sp. Leaf291]
MSVPLELVWPSGLRETVLIDRLHPTPDGGFLAVAATEGEAP